MIFLRFPEIAMPANMHEMDATRKNTNNELILPENSPESLLDCGVTTKQQSTIAQNLNKAGFSVLGLKEELLLAPKY